MNTSTQNRDAVRVHLNWMIRRHMPEVLTIEWLSFAQAWTEEDFLHTLRNRKVIGMVAEHGAEVIGFLIYELRERNLRLLNLAVHPDWRRRRVGSQMIAKLVSKLSSHRRTWISTLVRESNLEAQLFFRSQGFLATDIKHGYYENTREDAYRMQYLLPILETT